LHVACKPPGTVSARPCFLIGLVAACSAATAPDHAPDGGTATADGPQIVIPDGAVDAPSTHRYLCRQPAPAGAPVPDPPSLPAAGCPTLTPGMNTITSSGNQRQFLLVVPESPMPGEPLPVLFMWHWLGGSANSFLTKGEVQTAADQQNFIAVIPVAKGATVFGTSFNTRWPFDITQTSGRMNEEFKFFDDMLACVQQQYDINASCVSSVGVSAGALFTAQLAQARSNRLASFLSLSGGVGATIIKGWNGSARKLPGVVLWGGDGPPEMDGNKDILGCSGVGMDFAVASTTLENALISGGHFFIECKHNCGHVEPPLDAPPGESKYAGMWEFALNHPYWLPAGQSPFLTQGLPPSLPSWCGIGAGGAQPRTGGGCPEPENPCSS
jgi:predicted esterase